MIDQIKVNKYGRIKNYFIKIKEYKQSKLF